MSLLRMNIAALLISATTAAADAPMVKDVDVEFELDAVGSPAAAAFWKELETDLETAIVAQLVGQLAEEGARISVDIDELDLANSFDSALGVDSILSGRVAIKSDPDPTINTFYDLKISARGTGGLVATENGVDVLAVPVDEAYAAMINAFARNVTSQLR